MSQTQEKIGTAVESVAAQIQEGVDRGRFTIAQVQRKLAEKSRAAARVTDDYVHDNAWKVAGIAAGGGLLAGWLLSRPSRNQNDSDPKKAPRAAELVESVVPILLLTLKLVQTFRQKRARF